MLKSSEHEASSSDRPYLIFTQNVLSVNRDEVDDIKSYAGA